MLIGFSGSSGAGKTTLANRVAEALRSQGYDVAVVKEVVRDVFRKDWQHKCGSLDEIRESGDAVKFQAQVLVAQVRAELEAERNHSVVITDRTIYDNLLYTVLWHNKDFVGLGKYAKSFNDISKFHKYNVILLCEPLRHVDVSDDFRTKDDIESREAQFELLKSFIPEEIPRYVIHSYCLGDKEWEIETRVQRCLGILRMVMDNVGCRTHNICDKRKLWETR